ncbi:GntR family transcriptional regulator [Spirillospora sp. CA-255316]
MDEARTADRGPAYLKVAQDMRSRILRGDYEPGTPIPDEQTLAGHYGFSPTVVRNALIQLQEWRLVESGEGRLVLPPPKALFDGIRIEGPDPGRAIVGELLALDPRYVLSPHEDEDHLRFLIRKERIPIITGPIPDPARWMSVVLCSSDEEITLNRLAGCTMLIRTDLMAPPAAARSLHALAMA